MTGTSHSNRHFNLFFIIVGALIIANAGLYLRVVRIERNIREITGMFGPPETLQIGEPAPPFILSDRAGNQVALEDFEGNRVLIVFSSVTCPACQTFWPILENFHTDNRAIQVIMISQGSPEENSIMASEEGFDFPVFVWDDNLASNYKVPGTPFFYLLSEDHLIETVGFGLDLLDVTN